MNDTPIIFVGVNIGVAPQFVLIVESWYSPYMKPLFWLYTQDIYSVLDRREMPMYRYTEE